MTFRARDGEAELTGTYSQQLPCLTASSPSLARARKHVAMQLSPCHRIACAKSAPQVIGRCLTTLSAPTAVGDTEGGSSAILLVLSSLKYLKCSQTYTYFPGIGGTVTVENRVEFCSRQIRHFLRPCRSDVFVERPRMGSQQLPCLTASSPSLARARKHVAMQLSPCHRIACAKSAPQVIGRCLTTLSAPTAVGDTEGGELVQLC